MKPYRHPTIGLVGPMSTDRRPRKTWKHLYDPGEHWERIVPSPPPRLAAEAEQIAGVSRTECPRLPELEPRTWSRVRAVLDDHHDRFYAATYMAEIAAQGTSWIASPWESMRQLGFTPRGVLVVVAQGEPGHVVTAYRPHPPVAGVDMSEDDLRRYGLRHFRRSAGVRRDDLAREVADALVAQAGIPPRNAGELWSFAAAIGLGRALGEVAELNAPLAEAERVLAAAPEALVSALSAGLRWEQTLDEVADALKDEDREDLELALSRVEELLFVGDALGVMESVRLIVEQATELLAWLPASFAPLADVWATRVIAFHEQSPVRDLWGACAAAAAAACVRHEAPAFQPGVRLVDQLLPAPASWVPWVRQVATVPVRAGADVLRRLDELVAGLTARSAAPAMDGELTVQPWHLREASPVRGHARMFVVDDDYPEGYPVELANDCDLWTFERSGQRALVIVFVAATPLPAMSLREALALAQTRPDVAVRSREVSRPR